MKTLILLLLLTPLSINAFELNGTWIQDKKRTIEFNNKHVIQSKLHKALYNCSNEKIKFNSGIATTTITDYTCSYNNKSTVIKGKNISYNYKILYTNPNTVILETKGKNLGIYYINNENSIWLYTGNNSHLRQYYLREKNKHNKSLQSDP